MQRSAHTSPSADRPPSPLSLSDETEISAVDSTKDLGVIVTSTSKNLFTVNKQHTAPGVSFSCFVVVLQSRHQRYSDPCIWLW